MIVVLDHQLVVLCSVLCTLGSSAILNNELVLISLLMCGTVNITLLPCRCSAREYSISSSPTQTRHGLIYNELLLLLLKCVDLEPIFCIHILTNWQ